jgi:hypothetical protein
MLSLVQTAVLTKKKEEKSKNRERKRLSPHTHPKEIIGKDFKSSLLDMEKVGTCL